MASIFSKPLGEIGPADIEELFDRNHPELGVPESGTVEFKQDIPAKGGLDSWYSAPNAAIGEYGRNKILAEIVAFANAHGGHLLIGIEESENHPRRAVAICPVPRCAELADRLKRQIADCVDPTIPVVSVRGVETDGGGGGVVIVRVPQSRLAPHRVIANKECYFRHGDESKTMDMREIQDLTVQRAQNVVRLDDLFQERKSKFRDWVRATKAPQGASAIIGCRMTLIPTSDIHAENIFMNQVLVPKLQNFKIQLSDRRTCYDGAPVYSCLSERPIVRGTQRMDRLDGPRLVQEVHCSGLVELVFRERMWEEMQCPVSWLLGVMCNGFHTAAVFRKGAEAPDTEFEYEFEIFSTAPDVLVVVSPFTEIGKLSDCGYVYPRMSFGSDGPEQKCKRIEIALKDIWNSCGVPFELGVTGISESVR